MKDFARFPDRLLLKVSRGNWWVIGPIVSPRKAALVSVANMMAL